MTGKELKEKIDALHIAQKKLAEQMGVTPQTISAILTAKDVRTSTIERIASVTGMPISFFFYPEASDTQTAASGDGSVVKVETRGDYSPASVNGDASVEVKGASAAVLEERVKSLQALVEEKERTIRILMEGRK